MIRYRIFFLLLLHTNFLLVAVEDAPRMADNKINESKAPDKIVPQKSEPYSDSDDLIVKISNWIKNPFELQPSEDQNTQDDLSASASEHVSARYLASSPRFRQNARNCYECNSEPWTPIVGRSLNFPQPSHSNSLEEHHHHTSEQPYFREKEHVNKQYNLYHPPIDQYGAPQATFDYPRTGEVVDFMLPPPYQSQNLPGSLYGIPAATYGPPKPQYGPPKPHYGPPRQNNQLFDLGPVPLQQNSPSSIYRPAFNSKGPSFNYGSPSVDISPPPAVSYGVPALSNNHGHISNYGVPTVPANSYRPPPRHSLSTTHLRLVSQDFQPPLPDIQSLPLENNNPPPPVPSDSYGEPLGNFDSYKAPHDQQQYVEPITLGSGESFDYVRNYLGNFESQHNHEIKASLYQKGLTDVQVVPSVRIADYTASIEHPIDVIQSPILDLSVKDQESQSNDYGKVLQHSLDQSKNSYNEIDNDELHRLSENPIVVDDTYTSASNINTTYSFSENSTAIKRHNDKFLSSEAYRSHENKLKEADITTNLIQKLILEHNLIKDPHSQIVGIQKSVIDPQRVKTHLDVIQPSIDYSSWSPTNPSRISTAMMPPQPSINTWLSTVNESFVVTAKTPKKLQIIVPYLKAPEKNHVEWNHPTQKTRTFYNREYTTLTPVFVPPPLSTESTNLWTKLVNDIRTAESNKSQAQGFGPPPTTEVYNIKEFLAKQQHRGTSNLPYNVLSLQKNIDNWTHQSYANRLSFGDKLTTKLLHIKNIPQEYFTTTSNYDDILNYPRSDPGIHNDNVASSSNNKEFISKEIVDNFISPDEVTVASPTTEPVSKSTTPSSITYIVKTPRPSWEHDKVTFSNSTHEKVYVVTPQSYTQYLTSTPATAYSMAPKIQNGKVNNAATMTRISVRVEAPQEKGHGKELKPVKVVYSEWPHLINNLATTTTRKPTSRHPLFGRMANLSAYTPPPNSMVETIGGHSKVTSVVTPSINKYSSTSPTPTKSHGTVKISSTAS